MENEQIPATEVVPPCPYNTHEFIGYRYEVNQATGQQEIIVECRKCAARMTEENRPTF